MANTVNLTPTLLGQDKTTVQGLAQEVCISKSGDTMTGALNTVTPTQPLHAVNKNYVDQELSTIDLSGYVLSSGDTMTGPLKYGGVPVSGSDYTNKIYVDEKISDSWVDPILPDYVARAGDSMLGALYVLAPTNDYHATTKIYVDQKIDNEIATIDYPVDSVNGEVGAVVLNKIDIGLANVDNTSDLSKPISIATQNALDLKEDDLGNPSVDGYVLSSDTLGNRAWIEESGAVESVNGETGIVVLDTDDISEGSTNLYYTNARADLRVQEAIDDNVSSATTLYSSTKIEDLVSGAQTYIGAWNASTNTPSLADGVGSSGDYYAVSVAGSINLGSGVINFSIGDKVVYGTTDVWERIANNDAVLSVNTKTGDVVLDTSDIAENGNLYYTDARVDSRIGAIDYPVDSVNGLTDTVVLDTDDISEGATNLYYTDARVQTKIDTINYPVDSVNGQTDTVVLDTTDISEGSNLYYTSQRVDDRIGVLVDYPVDSINSRTGDVVLTSTEIAEGSNLYYTNQRVDDRINTLVNYPVTTVQNRTGDVVISKTDVGLSLVDNTSDQNKPISGDTQDAINLKEDKLGNPVVDNYVLSSLTDGTRVWVEAATGSVDSVNTQTGAVVLDSGDIAENGNLYYTDARVDAKIASIDYPVDSVNGITGTVILNSSHIAEGSNLYYTEARTDARVQSGISGIDYPVDSVNGLTDAVVLDTGDIAENGNLYYTDVRADIRIQEAIDDTTISATTLYSSTKIENLISGSQTYIGTWDADSNTPLLTDGSGTAGDYYAVSVAGSINLGSGLLDFSIGDKVIYSTGNTWERIANNDAVLSINSKTGDVVLGSDDISEGSTNLYYTDARVDSKIAGIDYPVDSVNGLTDTVVLDTDDISEGSTNLYYTDARVDAKLATVDYPVDSVNGETGTVVLDSGDISENGNLYYTDVRADQRVQAGIDSHVGTTGVDNPHDRVGYKGEWNGDQYYTHDQVTDSGWLMIANKDTTDRAAPQTSGAEYNLFSGTLAETTDTANGYRVGQRYTADVDKYINGYRLYTDAGKNYKIYTVINGSYNELGSFTASTTGWLVNDVTPIYITSGEVFDLIVKLEYPEDIYLSFSGTWDYQVPNNIGTPTAGEIIHSDNNPNIMGINKTDDLGADNSAGLEAVKIGDTFGDGTATWLVTNTTDHGNYVEFGVSPATQSSAGVGVFTFEHNVPQSIPYQEDTDYWLSQTTRGLFVKDGEILVEDDNQYNIDVLLQDISVSADWDVLSGGAGSGSSDTPSSGIHNELTGRDVADVHPIVSITGLQTTLDSKLNIAGGTVTGQIKGITPVDNEDLVRKDYVDQEISGIDYPVDSVNGEVGVVVLDSNDIAENGNLYYTEVRTDARVQAGINSINYPVDSVNGQTDTIVLDTGDIAEGTNLYYTNVRTDARVDAKIATLDYPVDSVNSQTGDVVLDTGDIAENGNLYYTDQRTDARVDAKISAIDYPVDSVNGQIGMVNLISTDISEGTNLYYTDQRTDARTVLIINDVPEAESSETTTFSASKIMSIAGEKASKLYTGTWDASTNTPTLQNGTGMIDTYYIVSVAGTHDFGPGPIDYAVGDKIIFEEPGTPGTGTWVLSLNSSSVRSVNSMAGDVVITSSTLNLENVDNTSDLNKPVSTATGTAIDLKEDDLGNPVTDNYILSSLSDGTRNWIVQNGAGVDSVNTKTGIVVLDSGDIAEGTNLYYTDARVDTRVDAAVGGIDYPVDSINGKTDIVVLDSGDISENGNLYYTDARVDARIDYPVDSVNGQTDIVVLGAADVQAVESTTSGYEEAIPRMVTTTQMFYDNITPVSTTLYIIKG